MKISFLPSYSYPLKVVGESQYQDNIQRVIGFIDDDQKQVREDGFSADLILEDDNPYDRGNAVRVDIDGSTVGYLTRSDAQTYRQSLTRLGQGKSTGNCPAIISGKWNEEVESLLFGVYLDLEPSRLMVMGSASEKRQAAKPVIANVIKAPAPVSSTIGSKSKIPFIPMKGKGCLYFLFVLPVILVINLYIALFAGLWFGGKWLWEIATASPTSRRVSAVVASLMFICGVFFSAVGGGTDDGLSTAPTLDLVSIQGTALAEAWLAYTQTAAALPTQTALSTETPTPTIASTDTSLPLPTNTLIVFETSTPFFLNLPANQPTSAPAGGGGSCSCSGDSLNCGDFGSWSSAQSCYTYCIAQGAGDIHRLDGNNDGSACDSLK